MLCPDCLRKDYIVTVAYREGDLWVTEYKCSIDGALIKREVEMLSDIIKLPQSFWDEYNDEN